MAQSLLSNSHPTKAISSLCPQQQIANRLMKWKDTNLLADVALKWQKASASPPGQHSWLELEGLFNRDEQTCAKEDAPNSCARAPSSLPLEHHTPSSLMPALALKWIKVMGKLYYYLSLLLHTKELQQIATGHCDDPAIVAGHHGR